MVDRLVAVDTTARLAFTQSGHRVPYDVLAVTTGARRVAPFAGALTFGIDRDAPAALRGDGRRHARGGGLEHGVRAPVARRAGRCRLYELALLTAHELREHGEHRGDSRS